MKRNVLRFIPVHTGNTTIDKYSPNKSAVHPRAYGEHDQEAVDTEVSNGSSPCIRGTRHYVCRDKQNHRFIPVHTGNTTLRVSRQAKSPVHPRAYGEHEIAINISNIERGSSPCIRGTQPALHQKDHEFRFIPVHTGNTNGSSVLKLSIAVHPRAYGEHHR